MPNNTPKKLNITILLNEAHIKPFISKLNNNENKL